MTVLSMKDFSRLADFIQNACGIQLQANKKGMVEGRLQKRLKQLSISTFDEYCIYLFSVRGLAQEVPFVIDAITTNKTDFFRENAHFDFLTKKAIPELVNKTNVGFQRKFSVWSAGCSTGEEPYTLSMVLAELACVMPGFQYSILATDICNRVLEEAKLAMYKMERVEPIPNTLKYKYLLQSRDPSRGLVRITPALREKVTFQKLNFVEEDFKIGMKMDVIFCRNVIIYFDRPTQEHLIQKFCRYLVPGGYLFLGHSESIANKEIPLENVAPTIYRKYS